MRRRRFDHLAAELSVAVGALVPRYPLWLCVAERGDDPEHLSREAALAVCHEDLHAFLADFRLELSARAERRLLRSLERFDSSHASPSEHMARLSGSGA